MEECYEFFACKKTDCIKRSINNQPCWEVEGTLCATHGVDIKELQKGLGSKLEVCKYCIYYTDHINHPS